MPEYSENYSEVTNWRACLPKWVLQMNLQFENDEKAILPYDIANTGIVDFVSALTPNSTLPVIQVLGVEFYQEVNGQMVLIIKY